MISKEKKHIEMTDNLLGIKKEDSGIRLKKRPAVNKEVKIALLAAYRGSIMLYDNLGIKIDTEKANALFAEKYGREPKEFMEKSHAYLRLALDVIE